MRVCLQAAAAAVWPKFSGVWGPSWIWTGGKRRVAEIIFSFLFLLPSSEKVERNKQMRCEGIWWWWHKTGKKEIGWKNRERGSPTVSAEPSSSSIHNSCCSYSLQTRRACYELIFIMCILRLVLLEVAPSVRPVVMAILKLRDVFKISFL